VSRFHHGSYGNGSKYVVFVPHDYTGNQPAPAILFLHGLGQSGDDGLIQAGRGLGDAIRSREQTFPFITIFPQSHERSWRADSEDGKAALEILDEVQKQFNIDPRRIYLTGYSMGGEGTWSLAAARTELFAAIVPICPGNDTTLVTKLKDTPCWCFQGDADAVDTVNLTRSMILAIQKAGGHPIYHEYPGVAHNCWDLTYANPDLYEWLLLHARK
jgi:predicted peptidase